MGHWVGSLALAAVALFATSWGATTGVPADNKVICYYDSKSFVRDGQAKMRVTDLDPALAYCTTLIYGFAGVSNDDFKLVPLNEQLDLDQGTGNYRAITNLKRRFPGLRVLLGVGGGADDQNKEKYLTLLENPEARVAFVNSAHQLVKQFGFDGLDLGWELPETKPKKIHGTLGGIWKGIKKVFGSTKIDEKEEEHRQQVTALIRETKNVFRHDALLVTLSVLPNVNSTVYYDVRSIIPNLDEVHLLAFDFYTAERNPKEADYAAPLYELIDRKPDCNVDAQVTYWLQNGAPASKIYLGIPTYGRTWHMDSSSAISGVPPLTIDGAGEEGSYTKQAGLLSYAEICTKINVPGVKGDPNRLRKVTDPTKRYGTYAFRLPNSDGDHGIWISYEDPDTVGNKAGYARAKGLGGVAVFDVSLDDFKGLCTSDKFPILRAAKYRT